MTTTEYITVLASAIVALLGAFGAVIVARNKAAETALGCWKELADERQADNEALKARLRDIEQRLSDTEVALKVERDRNQVLEHKVSALETERQAWRVERIQLQQRIAELEKVRVV